jgi:hypothetical protein
MAKKASTTSENKRRRSLRGSPTGVADYETANAELIKKAIVTAAGTGGALRFGYTADGGAYAIGIYGDDKPYTHYVSPHEELDITLGKLVELFEDIADELVTAENGHKRP